MRRRLRIPPKHPTPMQRKCQGGCGVYVIILDVTDQAWCLACGKTKGKSERQP